MTEKEKMDNQMLYDANNDKELEKERIACKMLCQEYNTTSIDNFKKRKELLEKILGKTGESILIEPDLWCDYGYRTSVGENFYSNHGLIILDAGYVSFGDNIFIGPNCGFHTSGHPIDYTRRNLGYEYAYPINVGNNVWFGAAVQVMPGVTIGDNCVIGSGSIVTKDIPPNSVAVGNPCKVIREITKEDTLTSWDRI